MLTYDDVNQREWLDLSATYSASLDSTLKDVSTGGVLESFTFATADHVKSLAASAGIPWESHGQHVEPTLAQHNAASELMKLLGGPIGFGDDAIPWSVASGSVGGRVATAYSIDATPEFDGTKVSVAGYLNPSADRSLAYWFPETGNTGKFCEWPVVVSYQTQDAGGSYWLYRDATAIHIPGPATLPLILLAITMHPVCHRSVCQRLRPFA